MTPAQRRIHLRVWLALAALLPIGIVAALLVRPTPPADQRRDAAPPAPSHPPARAETPR